jgi:hypothetical protein
MDRQIDRATSHDSAPQSLGPPRTHGHRYLQYAEVYSSAQHYLVGLSQRDIASRACSEPPGLLMQSHHRWCARPFVDQGAATWRDGGAAQGTFDLVVANGRVIDPETGLDALRSVGVRDGRIEAISPTPLAVDVEGTARHWGRLAAPGRCVRASAKRGHVHSLPSRLRA